MGIMYIIWLVVPVVLLFCLFRQQAQDEEITQASTGPSHPTSLTLDEQRARLTMLQAQKDSLPTILGSDLFKSEHKEELLAAAENLRHLIVDVVATHSGGEPQSEAPHEIPLDIKMARALLELGKAQVAVSITAAESEIKRLELKQASGNFTDWAATTEYKNDMRRLDSERDRLEAIVRAAEAELRRAYDARAEKTLPSN